LPADKLLSELASADWSRRHAAHEEFLRRGLSQAIPSAVGAAHSVWLGSHKEVDLANLATRGADDVRLQAIRALTEFSSLETIDGRIVAWD